MADGYFERGEIYMVRMDYGVGSEEGSFRPGVIVSSNVGNTKSPIVLVVYLTTKRKDMPICFETYATGKQSWVMCHQIATVDKSRLTKKLGALTYTEVRTLDDCLEDVFDLGYEDDTVVKEKDTEIEALKAKNAELVAEVAALKNANADELLSVRVETDMWQKLYIKTLDQLVEMKQNSDMIRRMGMKVEVPPAPEEPVLPEEPVDDKVDINNCTETALRKIGFTPAMGRLIVSRRPYKAVAEMITLPGMKANFFRIVEPKLCCTPMPVEPEEVVVVKDAPDPGYEVERKLNVNTASAKEIRTVTGWSEVSCYSITGKRKREGLFKSLDEITVGTKISPRMLDAHRDKLEV